MEEGQVHLQFAGTGAGSQAQVQVQLIFLGLKRDVTQRHQSVGRDRSFIFLNVSGPG